MKKGPPPGYGSCAFAGAGVAFLVLTALGTGPGWSWVTQHLDSSALSWAIGLVAYVVLVTLPFVPMGALAYLDWRARHPVENLGVAKPAKPAKVLDAEAPLAEAPLVQPGVGVEARGSGIQCPFCRAPCAEGYACPECKAEHHLACFEELGRCAVCGHNA